MGNPSRSWVLTTVSGSNRAVSSPSSHRNQLRWLSMRPYGAMPLRHRYSPPRPRAWCPRRAAPARCPAPAGHPAGRALPHRGPGAKAVHRSGRALWSTEALPQSALRSLSTRGAGPRRSPCLRCLTRRRSRRSRAASFQGSESLRVRWYKLQVKITMRHRIFTRSEELGRMGSCRCLLTM